VKLNRPVPECPGKRRNHENRLRALFQRGWHGPLLEMLLCRDCGFAIAVESPTDSAILLLIGTHLATEGKAWTATSRNGPPGNTHDRQSATSNVGLACLGLPSLSIGHTHYVEGNNRRLGNVHEKIVGDRIEGLQPDSRIEE